MYSKYIEKGDLPLLKLWEYSDKLCGCGSGLFESKQKRRKNTNYSDERANWTEPCCDECFSDLWNYYVERWNDYYSGLL